MKIALDAMGGDNAPGVNIEGAVEVVKEARDIEVILVGDESALKKGLSSKSYPEGRISIFHASEVIEMDAPPSHAIRRKKDSSVRRAVELVKSGGADAAVSAGNSGAMMALSMFLLGASEGVERPAIATVIPSFKEPFLLLDAGANVDCSPMNLSQFAQMGNAYCKHILGRPKPRVGLLSIGEEPTKGNELTKEAFKLIEKLGLNFIGNIESKDVFMGIADVVVCDGFVGNIFLKTSEGLGEVVMKMLKRDISSSASGKVGYLLMRPALRQFRKNTHYDEYGGAPLLGINGSCIICHGRSTSKAMRNALKAAADISRKRVNEVVSKEIKKTLAGEKTVVAG
jgi:glycerol-3-phosphate acyltransferase PlsX